MFFSRCNDEIVIECSANMTNDVNIAYVLSRCNGEMVIECRANMIRDVNGPITTYGLSLLHSL